ncbi:MAG: DUF2231 domain-containing protein [Desulforhopalus sp.]
MVENLYTLLENVGFSHPLHPALTHAPMGMVIGMVVFSFIGLFWRNKNFDQTAFYCSVLALVSIIPVIGAGILDWLHFFEGEWETLIIIKMILGSILTILLIIAFILKRKGTSPNRMFLIYLLCLACAGGLGFSGGELVYG